MYVGFSVILCISHSVSLSLSLYIYHRAGIQPNRRISCLLFLQWISKQNSLTHLLSFCIYKKIFVIVHFFLARTCFFHALPLFYQSSLSKRHNYNFHFAISEFIFLCVEKIWKVFPFCIPSHNTNLSVTSFSFDRFPIKTKVNMLPQ